MSRNRYDIINKAKKVDRVMRAEKLWNIQYSMWNGNTWKSLRGENSGCTRTWLLREERDAKDWLDLQEVHFSWYIKQELGLKQDENT